SPATSDPSSILDLDVKLSSPTHLTPHQPPDLVPATSPPLPPNMIDQLNAPDYPHSLPRQIRGGRVVRRTEALDSQQPRGLRRAGSPSSETTTHQTPDHGSSPSSTPSSTSLPASSIGTGHWRPSRSRSASTISCRPSDTSSSALCSARTECSAMARPSPS